MSDEDYMNDFDRAAWLLRSGWYTREVGSFVRWYYKSKNGSTLETNFDSACMSQRRRDAATAPARALADARHRADTMEADRDSAYVRGRDEERANCIEDVRAEARDCGCAMRIEARITKGDEP